MVTDLYWPTESYVIRSRESKHFGKALEVLMFQNYPWLHWILLKLQKDGERKTEFHRHLEWLLGQGDRIEPKMPCPYCQKRSVKFFSVSYSGNSMLFGLPYVYCEACKEGIDTLTEPIEVFPISFSLLVKKEFRRGVNRKKLTSFLRQIYGLKGKLTKEKAFDLFSSAEAPRTPHS